ncbi:MAG: cohesin domain-containing protein [bacterium]
MQHNTGSSTVFLNQGLGRIPAADKFAFKLVPLMVAVILLLMISAGMAADSATCPPPDGTPKNGDANGDGCNDWLIDRETDRQGNQVEVWCLDLGAAGPGGGDSFGYRYIPQGGTPVWVGKCAFNGGINRYSKSMDPNTGQWKGLQWKNWDDSSTDGEGTPGVIDDWFWTYDIPQRKLTTKKTHDNRTIAQQDGNAPVDFGDITFASLPVQGPDNNILALMVDPVITLVNLSTGPLWHYGLRTPPAHSEYSIDPWLLATEIKAGDRLIMKGLDAVEAYVEGTAALPEFGAWMLTSMTEDSVTFTASVDAIIPPGTLIDGFSFFSTGSGGQIEWMTAGEKISFVEKVYGPVAQPSSGMIFNEDDSGILDIGGTAARAGMGTRIPVRIQSTARDIYAFGFDVTYDPKVLEYTGHERGYLVASFNIFEVNRILPGRIRIGGVSAQSAIPAGAIGHLVWLNFTVIGGRDRECYPLSIEGVSDDLARAPASGGYFCVHNCTGDLNGDGTMTPGDALIAFQCYLSIGPCPDCADINYDGQVTPADALCIFRQYMGSPGCFPDEILPRKKSCQLELPIPDENISLTLSQPVIKAPGESVAGKVVIHAGQWNKDELPGLESFSFVLRIEDPSVALFPDQATSFEHIFDSSLIADDGSYQFAFKLVGSHPGQISVLPSLKWTILGEGACALAINGIYAGCALGEQLNSNCVCTAMADMPAPGSLACSLFPETFRAAWRS